MNLYPANILGVGAVTASGRNLHQITESIALPGDRSHSPRGVSEELIDLGEHAKRMRRADRFSRMAVSAALDAWNVANDNSVQPDRVGLIVTSGLGPHCRGFKFLDGILDCGDSAALPTDFSHSVHGAAAAYITEILSLRGPSLTTTDFSGGFEQAVTLAQCWLAAATCDRVIVGAVEELGEVMLHCVDKLAPSPTSPGEGAVFFVLGNSPGHASHRIRVGPTPDTADRVIRDDFVPHFGEMGTHTAFATLGLLLSAKHNPFDTAATVRPSCGASSQSIILSSTGAS